LILTGEIFNKKSKALTGPVSNCQNFHFQTVKNFHFQTVKNFLFQTVKNLLSKLSNLDNTDLSISQSLEDNEFMNLDSCLEIQVIENQFLGGAGDTLKK
jgi:hypothetical protein